MVGQRTLNPFILVRIQVQQLILTSDILIYMTAVLEIFFISLGLAMDAVSVSIAGGMKSQKAKIIHALKVAAFFGIFQAVMPVFGWLIGEATKGFISGIDHWVAFILLGIIGIKMIWEALNDSKMEKGNIFDTKTLLILSVATSIDALIVGITLNLLKTPFLISIAMIGTITFVLSFLGFLFGKQLGIFFGKKVGALGGIALILIGLKILIEHLI
jgi:putative Mn2+ efflux pump MntP